MLCSVHYIWLNGNILNGLLDPEGKCPIFLHDRKERRGGGVYVLTRRELNAFNIPVSDSYSDITLLCVDIAYCNAKCRIIVIYRSTDITQQSDICTKQLVQCLEHLACISYPCFIAGDLDAPTIDWAILVENLENCSDIHLLDFAIDNGFTQMVQETTRHNSILDVVLTNEPNTTFDVFVRLSVLVTIFVLILQSY